MPCGPRARLTAYVAYQELAFAERDVLLAALAQLGYTRVIAPAYLAFGHGKQADAMLAAQHPNLVVSPQAVALERRVWEAGSDEEYAHENCSNT